MAWGDDISEQVAEEFAAAMESELTWQQTMVFGWAMWRRQRDIDRQKDRRERKRILRLRHEERVCPVCKRKFRVLVGDKRGTPRVYDKPKCRETAKKRRHRTRVPPESNHLHLEGQVVSSAVERGT